MSKESLLEKIPFNLKAECLVRSKVETDEKRLKERQEMTRAMSPAELGQIRSLGDLPIPTFRKKRDRSEPKTVQDGEGTSKQNLYEKLPESLKTEYLVRTKVGTDEKVG